MLNGPISLNMPKSDDAPGPPWSHSSTGASASPESAGKNQKKVFDDVGASIVSSPACEGCSHPSISTRLKFCASS